MSRMQRMSDWRGRVILSESEDVMKRFSLLLVLAGCVGEDLPSIVPSDVSSATAEAGAMSSETGGYACTDIQGIDHTNGFQSYKSCAPVGTCDHEEALRACETYKAASSYVDDCETVPPDASGCSSAIVRVYRNMNVFGMGMTHVPEAMWAYDGPAKGHFWSNTDAAVSGCPAVTDERWY